MSEIEKNTKIECVETSDDGNYGKFVIEPLERGYGITLGNSLKRILQSSLPGAAVTSIKIDGVRHEFSTLPGVKEDVAEIILNIKTVDFKLYGEGPKTVILSATKKGEVTAADIKCDSDVEVLNPEQYICTINGEEPLTIEMEVAAGVGWRSADKNKDKDTPIGVIPIDSIFSPIKKVNQITENTRVGNMTDYDKLTLEVWTNGGVTPEDAISYSARVLIRELTLFANLGGEEFAPVVSADSSAEVGSSALDTNIEDLDLSVRSYNCLKRAGINTVENLVSMTEEEMLKVRNLGKKSFDEVIEKLEGMGLSLKNNED